MLIVIITMRNRSFFEIETIFLLFFKKTKQSSKTRNIITNGEIRLTARPESPARVNEKMIKTIANHGDNQKTYGLSLLGIKIHVKPYPKKKRRKIVAVV